MFSQKMFCCHSIRLMFEMPSILRKGELLCPRRLSAAIHDCHSSGCTVVRACKLPNAGHNILGTSLAATCPAASTHTHTSRHHRQGVPEPQRRPAAPDEIAEA
jgi:hypothetical protein